LSANNILSPAHGRPLVTPTQDMVIGAYYLTELVPNAVGAGGVYRHLYQAERAFEDGELALHAEIEYRGPIFGIEGPLKTTYGRLLFNEALPADFEYVNKMVRKREVSEIVDQLANLYPKAAVAASLDRIKDLCFRFAARAGVTISIGDVKTPEEKKEIL